MQWRQVLQTAAICTAVAVGITLLPALALGFVAWDPKLPAITPGFLLINLLFVCVAEESFMRGVIQEPLHRRLPARAQWLAPVAAACVFGLLHAQGGWALVLLATLAGLAYALAYARTRCVEAAILTHFGLNAAHFLLFTYPRLESAS